MKNLFILSDDELENSLGTQIKNERQILHIILEHIKEVSRRDLHLARGYGSLVEYLIKKFGYTERAAYRRVDGANLLKQVPSLVENIKNGSMDITKISDVIRAVKEKERISGEKVSALLKTELVARVAGKTSAESQKELAQVLDIKIKEHDSKRVQKDESVRVEFTVTKDQYDKIMKCQDLAIHKIQQENMAFSLASVIEILADKYIAEKTELKTKPSEKTNQTLTSKTKTEILQRDQCCQYKDRKTGKICGSTFALQTDHRTSKWIDGDNSKSNLQILCAQHNRYKYRQENQLKLL